MASIDPEALSLLARAKQAHQDGWLSEFSSHVLSEGHIEKYITVSSEKLVEADNRVEKVDEILDALIEGGIDDDDLLALVTEYRFDRPRMRHMLRVDPDARALEDTEDTKKAMKLVENSRVDSLNEGLDEWPDVVWRAYWLLLPHFRDLLLVTSGPIGFIKEHEYEFLDRDLEFRVDCHDLFSVKGDDLREALLTPEGRDDLAAKCVQYLTHYWTNSEEGFPKIIAPYELLSVPYSPSGDEYRIQTRGYVYAG